MAEARIGISLGYDAETLSDLGAALEAAQNLGVEAAEIFLPALGVVIAGRARPGALAELKRLCGGSDLALTLHGPLSTDLGRAETAALERDVLRASLEVAHEIGAGVYVQHGTRAADETSLADALMRERALLGGLADEARAAGVVIGVETLPGGGRRAASPAELAASLAALDHPAIGATLDYAHAALNCVVLGRDYLNEIAALAPHARHLHVHDCCAREAAFRPWCPGDALVYGFGDLHLPPGAGALPWADLAAIGWPGDCIANLEVGARWRWESAQTVRWTRNWAASARGDHG